MLHHISCKFDNVSLYNVPTITRLTCPTGDQDQAALVLETPFEGEWFSHQ